MWQTCYNRCVNNDEPTTSSTTTIPFSHTPTHSLSTVTMSTNSSLSAFREDAKATGISTVTTSSAYVTSMMFPDTELCRKPVSYVSAFTLSILWHVVYWTSQALTWFVICLSYDITVTADCVILWSILNYTDAVFVIHCVTWCVSSLQFSELDQSECL